MPQITPEDSAESSETTPLDPVLQSNSGFTEDDVPEFGLTEMVEVIPPSDNPEPRIRTRNRPKNVAPIPVRPETAAGTWVPVTAPKFSTFYSDQDNAAQRTKAAYNYWKGLTAAQKERIQAYVYRDWPVLKPIPDELKEYKYIDKILGNEPILDDNDLMDKYGSGDYHIFLNQELSPEVAKQLREPVKRTLATLYIRGRRDLQSRPPCDKRVSDIDQVDLLDPVNKSYVEFLRMRGKLPEQQSKDKAEAEMATVEAMKEMASTNARMVDKVIDMAREDRQHQPPPTADAAALSNVIGIMSDAAKRSNEMLQDTITSIREKDGSGGADMLNTALSLAERLTAAATSGRGNGEDSALLKEVQELRNQVTTMQNERIANLERRLEQAAEKASAPPPPPPPAQPLGQFSSIEEGIGAFKKMKTLVEEVTGGGGKGGDSEGEDGPAGPAWLRTVGTVMPHVSTVVTAARDMFAIWQMGQRGGVPGQMPQGPPQPQQPQSQPQQSMQYQQGQPVQQPYSQPGPVLVQPQQQIQPQVMGLPAEVVELLSSIKISFLNHLEGFASGEKDPETGKLMLTGAEFADWFIGGFGEEYYKNVAQYGETQLLQAVYAFSPIASKLSETKATPEQVVEFIHDFVTLPMEEDGGEGESNGKTMAAGAGTGTGASTNTA